MLDGIWTTLGPWVISALGGAIGASLIMFTKLGEIAFKGRVDRAIEAFKADQSQKLEEFKTTEGLKLEALRERLGHFGDRGRRSNELEFAAIREVWEAVVEAHGATHDCLVNYVEYPDLSSLSDDDLEAFLSTTGFSVEQNEQIKGARDHNDMFVKITTWRSIATAERKIFDARSLLKKQRIFMPDGMRAEFQAFIDMLNGAQVERLLQFRHPHIPRDQWGDSIKHFFTDHERMHDAVATSANLRLFREEA